MAVVVKTVLGSNFGVFGVPPIIEPILVGIGMFTGLVYVSGDWDVHLGYDLDFDPWPNVLCARCCL